MEVESSTIQLLGVAIAILLALWRIYAKLDDQIGKLSEANQSLGREFSDLKGEIKTKFALQDKQSFQEIIDDLVKKDVAGNL